MLQYTTLGDIRIYRIRNTYVSSVIRQISRVYFYDESSDDIISLGEDPYEYRPEEKFFTGNSMRLGEAYGTAFNIKLEYSVLKALNQSLNLNISSDVLIYSTIDDLSDAFDRGDIDIMVMAAGSDGHPSISPTIFSEYSLFIKQPDYYVSSTFFTALLGSNVWILTLITVLLVFGFAIIYKIFLKSRRIHIFEIFLLICGISSEDSNAYLTKSFKVIRFVFGLFWILILTAFSTFLITELSIKEIKLPFQDLDDLTSQGIYSVCALINTPVAQVEKLPNGQKFNTGNCPKLRDMDYNIVEWVNYMCTRENTAYLTERRYFYPGIILKNLNLPCKFYETPGLYFRRYDTIYVQYGINHQALFRRGMIQIRTSGILDIDRRKGSYLDEIDSWIQANVPDPEFVIYFGHIQLILLGYFIAIVLSVIIMLFEIKFAHTDL